jgi:hypothetical protein
MLYTARRAALVSHQVARHIPVSVFDTGGAWLSRNILVWNPLQTLLVKPETVAGK